MANLDASPFKIGIDHWPTDPKPVDRDQLNQVKVELGIPVDTQEKIDTLIAKNNWTRIDALPGGIHYPTLDEWLVFRVEKQRVIKFYPCFVKDQQGRTVFVKIQVRRGREWRDLLINEHQVLQTGLFLDVNPSSLRYHETVNGDDLTFLSYEAIPFSEGRVASVDEWDADITEKVCDQILAIEAKGVDESWGLKDLYPNQVTTLRKNFAETEPYLLTQGVDTSSIWTALQLLYQPCLAHGDLTPYNIIVMANGTVRFVDFEKSGIGFVGQNTGKLMNRLATRPELQTIIQERFTSHTKHNQDDRFRLLQMSVIVDRLTTVRRNIQRLKNEPYRKNLAEQDLRISVSFISDLMKHPSLALQEQAA